MAQKRKSKKARAKQSKQPPKPKRKQSSRQRKRKQKLKQRDSMTTSITGVTIPPMVNVPGIGSTGRLPLVYEHMRVREAPAKPTGAPIFNSVAAALASIAGANPLGFLMSMNPKALAETLVHQSKHMKPLHPGDPYHLAGKYLGKSGVASHDHPIGTINIPFTDSLSYGYDIDQAIVDHRTVEQTLTNVYDPNTGYTTAMY